MSNFHEIAPNSTYSQKSLFFKLIAFFSDQLLHPYKFHDRDMSGILFFILPVLSRSSTNYWYTLVYNSQWTTHLDPLLLSYLNTRNLFLRNGIESSFFNPRPTKGVVTTPWRFVSGRTKRRRKWSRASRTSLLHPLRSLWWEKKKKKKKNGGTP